MKILVLPSLQVELMLKMYRNGTDEKGAMASLFPGETSQTVEGRFFSRAQLQQSVMFCIVSVPPYNSPTCPWNKAIHCEPWPDGSID